VLATSGEPPKFDFKHKDHVDLLESLDLADLEAGTRVAGQKFYFLKNEGALLELALVQYAMQTLVAEGYTPVVTPDLARVDILEGIGFLPRDPNPDTRQVYTVADTDLCLIATAEITLGGMHRDQIFDEDALPKKYVGLSHCFRTEAGAAGRTPAGCTASTSSPRSRCSPSAPRTRARGCTRSCGPSRRSCSAGWGCRSG
jgi:seryl-tRNA synthetase